MKFVDYLKAISLGVEVVSEIELDLAQLQAGQAVQIHHQLGSFNGQPVFLDGTLTTHAGPAVAEIKAALQAAPAPAATAKPADAHGGIADLQAQLETAKSALADAQPGTQAETDARQQIADIKAEIASANAANGT